MARLPQELCDQVAGLSSDNMEGVPDFNRSSLATISRTWQMAFERQTFKRIRLKSTDLASFERIVTNQRRHFLQTLDYTILLPTYSEEARGLFERESDRLSNDEALTAAIQGLFRILRTWNERDDGKMQFRIDAVYSEADESSIRGARPLDVTYFRRHQYSYIRLLRPEELPEVRVISAFRTRGMPRRWTMGSLSISRPSFRMYKIHSGICAIRSGATQNYAAGTGMNWPNESEISYLKLPHSIASE